MLLFNFLMHLHFSSILICSQMKKEELKVKETIVALSFPSILCHHLGYKWLVNKEKQFKQERISDRVPWSFLLLRMWFFSAQMLVWAESMAFFSLSALPIYSSVDVVSLPCIHFGSYWPLPTLLPQHSRKHKHILGPLLFCTHVPL